MRRGKFQYLLVKGDRVVGSSENPLEIEELRKHNQGAIVYDAQILDGEYFALQVSGRRADVRLEEIREEIKGRYPCIVVIADNGDYKVFKDEESRRGSTFVGYNYHFDESGKRLIIRE